MISVITPTAGKRKEWLEIAKQSVLNQTYRDWEHIVVPGNNTAKNINIGIQQAKGDYIKLLSDDDILMPNCLRDLLDGIDGYDFVCGNAEAFGDKNYVFESEVRDLKGLLRFNSIHGGAVMYRKQVLIDVGGFDEGLKCAEEYDMHLKLLSEGYTLGYIDQIVYKYRVHGEQKSDYVNRVWRWEEIAMIKARYK